MSIPIFYPLPRTRKGIKILMGVLGTVCLAAAIIVFFFWSADQKALAETGQPDFNTLSQDELKADMIVTGSIEFTMGYYAEVYETNFNIRTSDDSEALYYVIPIFGGADGSFQYFITYKAEPNDFDTMEQVYAQTWSGEPPAARLTVENAKIGNLSGELKQYLAEWANDKNFYENGSFIDWCAEYNVFGTADRSVIASRLVPYFIYRTDAAGTDITIAFFFLGMAVLCFGIMLIMIFVKAPIRGVAENPAAEDFSAAREMERRSHTES